jgi:hypothetical protein
MTVTFDAAGDGDNVIPSGSHQAGQVKFNGGAPMKTDTATQSDLEALTALNSDYIHSGAAW